MTLIRLVLLFCLFGCSNVKPDILPYDIAYNGCLYGYEMALVKNTKLRGVQYAEKAVSFCLKYREDLEK